MKKEFLLFAFAVLLAASCSKDQTIRTREDQQPFISFTTISDRLVKSEEITTNNLGAFLVTGFYYTGTANYATNTKFFNATTVTSDSDGDCSYSPVRYWPTTGKIDFFAYKHLTLGTLTETTVPFSCSVPNEVALQKDVVVTKAIGKTKPSTPTSVALHFHHALSQIKFAARSGIDGIKLEVTDITLINILPEGSSELVGWVIPTSVTAADGNGLVWAASGTATNYSAGLDHNTNIPYSTTDYTDITAANGALMLIPQTTTSTAGTSGKTAVSGKTYIKVSYKAYDSTTNMQFSEGDYYYGLNATWKPGVRYTYNISFNNAENIGLEPITFEASVEGWVDDAAVGVII